MGTALEDKWRFILAAVADPTISHSAVRMAVAICRFDGDAGLCFASFDTLGEATGLKRRQAINLVQELEKAAWITVERRGGKGQTNRIWPCYDRTRVQSTAPKKRRSKGAKSGPIGCNPLHPNALSSRESEWRGARAPAPRGGAYARPGRSARPRQNLTEQMLQAGGLLDGSDE